MQYYRNPLEEAGRFFRSGNLLSRLIIINTAIWLLVGVIRVISFLFKFPDKELMEFLVDVMALPADTGILITRIWTLLTYMFFHLDFFHLLFNMLWLFWFGKIFLEFLKSRQLLFLYLTGGLSGGILYILFYNIFPVFQESLPVSVALGASASVMAIVTAISIYVPGYTVHLLFLGRIRIFYIALFLFVLDFFMIRSENAGGHIAHIGGAVFGLIYILSLRKGMNFNGVFKMRWFKQFTSIFGRRKMKVVSGNYRQTTERPLTDDEFNRRRAERQRKIDDILDKVARSGYESLSKEEKDMLFNASRSGD